jgi:hypothetical protein
MNRHLTVFAQSFLSGTFDWIASGVDETTRFVREWVTARFNAEAFGVITAIVVIFAVLARVHSGRRL